MTDPLLAIADELYGLPLADFTPRRDALVKEHKGDKELAGRIKALRKPSVAAWVVNVFVRRDPDQVEQVLQVGAALRAAQDDLDAAQLRALTKQRRQLTAAVTTSARRLVREEGHKVTESVADQVEATLTAAMLDEGASAAVRSGLLVTALAATGVDAVDAGAVVAVPEALGFSATARPAEPPGPPDLRVVPDTDEVASAKAIAAAEAAVESARSEVDDARAEVDSAAQAVSDLQARSMQLQAEIDELRRRISELEDSADEVDEELSEAEDTHAEAVSVLSSAESTLSAARAALGELR